MKDIKPLLVKVPYWLLVISIVLFLISLTQNAFYVDGESGYHGYLVIIFGFFGVFGGGSGFSWLANIMILLAWGFHKKQISMYLSLAALALGLSFLAFDDILLGTSPSNNHGQITGYDLGYYLWILSFLLMSLGRIINYTIPNKHKLDSV